MATATDSAPWALLVLVLALVLLPPFVMLLAMPMMSFGMMGGGMGGAGFPAAVAVVVGLVPLLVLVAVGYLAYRVVTGNDLRGGRDPAVEELRLALARGDVSREEYEQRRELLERGE